MPDRDQETHLCTKCYEVNKGFVYLRNETKGCMECGGTVLFIQEAADYIAELKEENRGLKEIYE